MQESGRAGRDGQPALCLLLWRWDDKLKQQSLMEENKSHQSAEWARSQEDRLYDMASHCVAQDCLRARLLKPFGEELRCGRSAVMGLRK